ncbi:hypothetical protein [Anaplasma bovis]|uniref:hypothetical protein n=1 Tax=Anaplasma bovis TaxID=186733 RepID=UPI002FF2AEFA
MHDVSKAINILDPTEGIDKRICGSGKHAAKSGSAGETTGKCGDGQSDGGQTGASSNNLLSDLFSETTTKSNYATTKESKMGPITSGVIASDTASLTREQKGVVSSAFAKAATSSNNTDTARYTSKMYIL